MINGFNIETKKRMIQNKTNRETWNRMNGRSKTTLNNLIWNSFYFDENNRIEIFAHETHNLANRTVKLICKWSLIILMVIRFESLIGFADIISPSIATTTTTFVALYINVQKLFDSRFWTSLLLSHNISLSRSDWLEFTKIVISTVYIQSFQYTHNTSTMII